MLRYTRVHLSCYLPFYYLARLLLCLDLKRLRQAFQSFSAAASSLFSCARARIKSSLFGAENIDRASAEDAFVGSPAFVTSQRHTLHIG